MEMIENGALQLEGNTCHGCGAIKMVKEENLEKKSTGFIYVIVGWFCFFVSLFFLPIVFGTAAVFMGVMTFFERSLIHGAILFFFGAAGLVIGTLFSIMVAGTMFI